MTAPYAVLLSRIATATTRSRGFPLAPHHDHESSVLATVTVHARRWWERGRLVGAAETQRAVARSGALAVPAVLGAGRSHHGQWLAEQFVAGRHLHAEELQDAAAEVVTGLMAHWRTSDLQTRALDLRGGELAVVLDLLRDDRATGTGADSSLADRLPALVSRGVVMVVGPCHGDPVPGNVLRAADDRLVLLDWEHAGAGDLARDLVKVALGVPDAEAGHALLALAAPQVLDGPGLRASPWQLQVAGTLVRWLAGWRQQHQHQVTSGRAAPSTRRLHRRLNLLARVLDATPRCSGKR